MLVLARKPDEAIRVIAPSGEEILIRLLRISPTAARIGVEAPQNYGIVRGELEVHEALQVQSLAKSLAPCFAILPAVPESGDTSAVPVQEAGAPLWCG